MDITMPKLDGLEATRLIMETQPTPIIIVSSNVDQDEVNTTFRALEAGALQALRRVPGPGHPDYERMAQELCQAVRLMSEIKVVRRMARRQPLSESRPAVDSRAIRAVGIGASTGGPVALERILKALPVDFPVPIFVVQHMAAGFIHGMAEWLDQSCALEVRVARNGELAQPGTVYFAPEDVQLGLSQSGHLRLTVTIFEDGFRPSASYLFRTLAEVYGAQAVGILLTGMGQDGARGLQLMRERGAVTIAQDEESSVVFGMPREAIRRGAAQHVLSPERIPALLCALVASPAAKEN
jgi:two-component system chemotaxis response regulator CheB